MSLEISIKSPQTQNVAQIRILLDPKTCATLTRWFVIAAAAFAGVARSRPTPSPPSSSPSEVFNGSRPVTVDTVARVFPQGVARDCIVQHDVTSRRPGIARVRFPARLSVSRTRG